jgi:hypothetical protein
MKAAIDGPAPVNNLWARDRCGNPQSILHLLRGHWLCDLCIAEAEDL